MSIFCFKKIDTAVRLGDQLRSRRETLKLSLEQAADRTRIPLKYLAALESSMFTDLPKTTAHRLAYVKEYTKFLGLSSAVSVSQFTCEDGLEDSQYIHPQQAVKLSHFASISIFVRNAVMISAVVLFSSYLVWQVKGVLEPPRLAVYSPQEGYVINQPRALIVGETDKETHLSINGQSIMVNEQGKFEAPIDLSSGVNTIIIEAAKKHGKTTTVVRHVVVKQAPSTNEVSVR